MGLAYDLDVETWNNFGKYLPDAMIHLANTDPTALMLREQSDTFWGTDWSFRFCGTDTLSTNECQAIFPTGEYIIRDATFINGNYVFVGSYKAYFRDLYGATNHGYAWDGFIMTLRGYSYDNTVTAPFIFNRSTGAFMGFNPHYGAMGGGWGFMPMRMPIDIMPGVFPADVAAVADDSSVGLQAVDVWKNALSIHVGVGFIEDSANIKVVAVGFQRVGDPVAQHMTFSDIDYVGFIWNSQLLMIMSPRQEFAQGVEFSAQPYYGGFPSPDNYPENPAIAVSGNFLVYQVARQSTYQTSWRATDNYTCPLHGGSPPDSNTRLRNLDVACAISSLNTGGVAHYRVDMWAEGYLPDGTSLVGQPPIVANADAVQWDFIPRRFMDVCCYSEQTATASGGWSWDSPFVITGDMSCGGDSLDPTPTIDSTVPMTVGCLLPSTWAQVDLLRAPLNDKARLYNPYMMCHVGGVSDRADAAGGISEFVFIGSYTLTNSLDGAYGAFVQIPYERMTTQMEGGENPSEKPARCYVAVNGITDSGGGTGAGVFTYSDPAQYPNAPLTSMIAPNQDPTLESQGITTPVKWYSKAMQSRTFTQDEEAATTNFNHFEPSIEAVYIINSNNGEPVGILGNYQRYGLDDDPDGTLSKEKQEGSNSRQAFGLLGWNTTLGPVCYMFDSGRGWFKSPNFLPVTNPNYSATDEYSNVTLNVGATFNSKILLNPNLTTRKAVYAQWDNDRDQWLFWFSNPTDGLSGVSVTSTFSPSKLGADAYLDQTDSFSLKAPTETEDYQTAGWLPFLMTNNMDGIVFFGGDDETNSGSGDIWEYTGVGADNKYWMPAVIQSTGTQTPPNDWGPCSAIGTIDYKPSTLQWFNISGSTGRTAKVWVDYILLDGADAVIATKLRERGMKVTIEAVEWFKRKIINKGDLNIKQEEIEMWMREQQDEFKQMMSDAERQGRVRKRKKQVSAYGLDLSEVISPDFEDKEVQEFMKEYLPKSRPPTPEEQAIEKQRKGGYAPFSKNYYDEVFET